MKSLPNISNQIQRIWDTSVPVNYVTYPHTYELSDPFIMRLQINRYRHDLTNVSAKTKSLAVKGLTSCYVTGSAAFLAEISIMSPPKKIIIII